jgi:hypothetical protein
VRTSEFAKQAEAIKEAIAREDVPQVVAEEPPAAIDQEPIPAPVVTPVPLVAAPAPPQETSVEEDEPLSRPVAPVLDSAPTADAQEDVAATPTEPQTDDETEAADEDVRILFAERDDFLADVDAGINENEFKW